MRKDSARVITMNLKVLQMVKSQIAAAAEDLKAYKPSNANWPSRAMTNAERLIPWLFAEAHNLNDYVQDVLNAPAQLRRMWDEMREHVDLPKERIEAYKRQLSLDDILRESVTGDLVSKVITKFLIEKFPKGALQSNGRSDYPDLYLRDIDYSFLHVFQRIRNGDEYGAALKGADHRPVRVPDGLEIKTCRNRIAVDCHHPHAGLHLVLLFSETNRLFSVDDIRIAFLRQSNYHESERNTTATTVKYSFNGDQFVSLL
ncbi:MAG: hypothetical protein PHO54_05955 [Candidatus Peribacteraceae bacterium]|nr:hypothetical protein [Candidatus Peribacteraceae bacterium]